jgi:hypothetical protein
MFREYYIGRKGMYHNKNVVVLSTFYNYVDYQDFNLDFNRLEVVIYYEDGTKKLEKLKGAKLIKSLKLYDDKK